MAFPASPTSPLVELAALSCTRTPCLLSFLRRDGRGSRLTPAAAQRPTPIQQSASLHPTAEGSFPGNERARSPPALLSQPSCSGQAARLRLRHLAAGPRPALGGYHESQPSRLPASEPSRRGRARSPRSHHSRAMTRTGHSLLLSRPRPTCRSSRRRPVRTPCLRSLIWAQTHRPAGGTSGRRRPLRTQPLPSAESCCCPGNERVRSSLSFLSQRNCCLPPPVHSAHAGSQLHASYRHVERASCTPWRPPPPHRPAQRIRAYRPRLPSRRRLLAATPATLERSSALALRALIAHRYLHRREPDGFTTARWPVDLRAGSGFCGSHSPQDAPFHATSGDHDDMVRAVRSLRSAVLPTRQSSATAPCCSAWTT